MHAYSAQLVISYEHLYSVAVDEVLLKESRAYSDVMVVVAKHCNHVDIQNGGLLALAGLLEIDSYAASSISLQREYDFILQSIKKHTDNPGVVGHGFRCLRIIVK